MAGSKTTQFKTAFKLYLNDYTSTQKNLSDF